MAYTKQTWRSRWGRSLLGALWSSAISRDTMATRLDHMEDGIYDVALSSNTGSVSIKALGAVGDGVADDSAAFIAARTLIESNWYNTIDWSTSDRGRMVVEVPPGIYRITQSEAMLRPGVGPSGLAAGLKFRGGGKFLTQIIFEPTGDDQYLASTDRWMGVQFEGIEFVGWPSQTIRDNYTEASYPCFFKSDRQTLAPQQHMFRDCTWHGYWKVGVHLTGTNNNSELSWWNCQIRGHLGRYLWASSSDQFLDYNFYACDMTPDSGVVLDFTLGGNINIHGGYWNFNRADIPVDDQPGHLDQIFVRLGGGTHSAGTQRLKIDGVYVEFRSLNHKMLDSSWGKGGASHITLENISAAGSSQMTDPATGANMYGKMEGNDHESIVIRGTGGQNFPIVTFNGGMYAGRHVYEYDQQNYAFAKNVVYRDVVFYRQVDPNEFVKVVKTDGGSNFGGKPHIRFENCTPKRLGVITTGSITAGTNTLTIADAGGNVAAADNVKVAGAGTAGVAFESTVSSGQGTTTLTLAGNAVTSVTDAKVEISKPTAATEHAYMATWEADINWMSACGSRPRRKVAQFIGSNGGLPSTSGTVSVFLPKNAVIVRASVYWPAGATGSTTTGWVHTIEDESGTVHHTATPTSNNPSLGCTGSTDLFYLCDTNVKRRLLLKANATVNQSPAGLAIVEYL